MPNLESEWLAKNKYIDYPFRAMTTPDTSVPSGPSIKQLNTLFVDAVVVIKEADIADHEILLRDIDVAAETITLYDNDASQTIACTGLSSAASPDGEYKTLYGYSDDESVWLTVVVWTDSEIESAEWSTSGLSFIPRTNPHRVAKVDNLLLNAGAVVISLGEVAQLAEGNNIRLELNPDTARIAALRLREPANRPPTHRIVISAEAGAGEGKTAPGCNDPVDGVITLNGQSPIDGDMQIVGDGCYRVSRPPGTLSATEFDSTPNTLRIENDCQVCCDCADFSDVLEGIRALKDEGLAIKAMWDEARAAFEEVVAAWQLKQACIGTECIAQLYAYSYEGWLVTVQIWIGNPENCLKAGASVDVTFGGGDFAPIYVPGSGHVYNDQSMYSQIDPVESGGVFTIGDNSAIKGGGYKMLAFTVRMQSSDDRVAGANVNIAISTEMCGQDPVVTGTSVQLKANLNKT